jgi:hypothetical protein
MLVHGRYKKFAGKATFFYLFEVSADNVDDIGGLFRGLGIARHVVEDVIFHQLVQ